VTEQPDAASAYLQAFADGPGYLDFARVGPLSRQVISARADATGQLADPTSRTIDALMQAGPRSLALAARVAGLPVERLSFVPNTSTGLFQVAFALVPRGPRDQILIAAEEFPANTYPWVRAHAAGRLAPVWLPRGAGPVTPELLSAAVTDRTAAVSLSAVDFRTGHRADLTGIREVLGDRLLVVDGIQAFGAMPMDWAAADALVVGGQKWLRSGWGTGLIAVSDRLAEQWDPLLAGWTAVSGISDYDGTIHPTLPGAGAMSITNYSPIDQAAFESGLRLVDSVGVPWIHSRIVDTVDLLSEELRRTGAVVLTGDAAAGRSGIVPFRPGRITAPEAHRKLLDAGVSSTLHGDRVRLSVHATTTAQSVAMVVGALGA
jgi:selenocysteine lyase/cysteine desulfurase